MAKGKQYNIEIIDKIYNQFPSFTEVFDEDTWYIFVMCFTISTIFIAVVLSRFITIKPLD
jgi:large subunit ribosomal protein L53